MLGEDKRVRDALASAGVNRALEIFHWSQGDVMDDQRDVSRNRFEADELSRRLTAYIADHPGKPVHVVGISAGTGVAVWAIEDLPGGMKVTGAVLLASSLDSRYDLGSALGKVDDAIYSFSSVADAVLGLGVTLTGTVDRGGAIAGGLAGFSPPKNAPPDEVRLYKEKLVQIPWWPGYVVLGNPGDHLGSTNPLFVKACIAPLVLGRKPHRPMTTEAAAEEANDVLSARAAANTTAPAAPATATRSSATGRFTDWSVSAPPADRPTGDEAIFYREPGSHP
jgi:pimeloyl-ACP methyl ester carboxylesterase